MTTRHSSGVSRICQEGRTQFLENLIDDRLDELQDLTDRLYRWPIPRPLIMRQRKRALRCLAWLGGELKESAAYDEQLLATAAKIIENADSIESVVSTDDTSMLRFAELPVLDHDAAAEAGLAVVEDR